MSQQLCPRASGGIGKILHGTLRKSVPAGRSLSGRSAQRPKKRKSRIADPKKDHDNEYPCREQITVPAREVGCRRRVAEVNTCPEFVRSHQPHNKDLRACSLSAA